MRISLILIIAFLITIGVKGQSINTKKVAVEGYDLVAYYTVQQAIQGSDKLSVKVEDIYYYFSNPNNQKLFEKDPGKYIPKYGGFCAIGIALYDGRYPIDPESFLLDNGELYLFCPGEIDNWRADQDRLRELADIKWTEMNKTQTLKKE